MNQPGSPFKIDPLNDSRCLCGLCVLETITRVAEAVQSTPRRPKLLLFIGSSMIWQARRPISASYPGPRVRDAARGCARRHVRGNRPREPDRALHRSTGSRQRCAAVTGIDDEPRAGVCVASLQSGLTNTLTRPREPECPSCSDGRPGRGGNEQPRADDSRDFPRERRVLRDRCRACGVDTARRRAHDPGQGRAQGTPGGRATEVCRGDVGSEHSGRRYVRRNLPSKTR